MASSPWSLIISSIPILVSLYVTKDKARDELAVFPNDPKDLNLPVKKFYDFIVVGGGTAGSIVASQLSKKFSVLLIEAGSVPPPLVTIPHLYDDISQQPDINFVYRSVPQKNSGLDNGGIFELTGGKMLGGSSSHNGMAWQRGNSLNYDEWAELTGDDSWKYKNVLKFFKKLENYHGSFKGNGQHGYKGPVDINEESFDPGRKLWLKAGQELRYKIVDPDGLQSVGFSPIAFAKRKGHRVSSYTAFIKPILRQKGKKGLKILKYGFVTKLLTENKKAIGVEFTRHGVQQATFATKEVILSAGTFMTPVILIRSGIGPKDQVKVAKVNPVATLPVGRNLMDTPVVSLDFSLNKSDSNIYFNFEHQLTNQHVTNFVRNGSGPLSTSVYPLQAFILSSRAKSMEESTWPDVRIVFSPFGESEEAASVSCAVLNTRPISRGVLTVNFSASDENFLPIVDHKYFQQESDLNVMIEGIEFALQVMENTEAFQSVGSRLIGQPHGPCKNHKLRSRAYWECYIRHKATSIQHSVGTCRMGRSKNDPDAVVDSKFRVIGVQNLRVVDASIFSVIPNSSPASTTWMIGLKAADEITRAHSQKSKI